MHEYTLRPIGRVESPITERSAAPKQADESAPAAWLVFDERVRLGLKDLRVGSDILILTWLHRSERDVLVVHPRDDRQRPETGVFSTRSPDRPNPIGLHRATVEVIDGLRIQVSALEAIDGTPIVDVKPILGERTER